MDWMRDPKVSDDSGNNKSCNVPVGVYTHGLNLGSWLGNQKRDYRIIHCTNDSCNHPQGASTRLISKRRLELFDGLVSQGLLDIGQCRVKRMKQGEVVVRPSRARAPPRPWM